MSLDAAPFTKSLINLRIYEELILMGYLVDISAADEQDALNFLTSQYVEESSSYPFDIPDFNPEAAIWAAKLTYTAAQLLIFRQHKAGDLTKLINQYPETLTPGSILSADLCMRFLPDIIQQLKAIDPEDVLIELLETILQQWHYSAVSYPLDYGKLNFEMVIDNPCLFQLYLDRIATYKNLKLAQHPVFLPGIIANLGIYAPELWNDFKKPETSDE